MKKKENLWELIERLDREAGEFNYHLSEANRYFDTAAKRTKTMLSKQEKQLHTTIAKVQEALRRFTKQNKPSGKDGNGSSAK